MKLVFVSLLGMLWGCGGEDPQINNPNTGTAGTTATAPAPAGTTGSTAAGTAAPQTTAGRGPSAGTGTTTPPRAGTGTPPVAGMAPAAAGSGIAGVGSAGTGTAGTAAGAPAGTGGTAGSGGAAGTATAGTGGTAGTGSTTPSGAFAVRGADPTMMSANGRQKGPYMVMSYTSGYMRGNFSDATMWYPASEDAKPPFGCVAVVPGFVSPQSSIRNWGPFLASHGIVTITIGVPGSDQPAMRARSLMSALETCKGEGTRQGSPIMGKLSNDHLGVSGWSMGGGGTLIAASMNPNLKAGVSFAAWGPSGGASNKVPVLMFEATADALAAGMSDGFFRAVPDSVPKMLFEVQGSSHNVANDPANHDGIIGLYGLSWWKTYLEGDTRYKQFLTAPKPSITTSKFAHNLK